MRIPDNAHLCCILYSIEDYVNKMKCYEQMKIVVLIFPPTRKYRALDHRSIEMICEIGNDRLRKCTCSYLSMIVKRICTLTCPTEAISHGFLGLPGLGFGIIHPPLINYMGMIIQIGPSRFGRR